MAVLVEENDLDVEEILEDFDDEAWDDEAWDDEAWGELSTEADNDWEAWDDEALGEALPRRYRRRYGRPAYLRRPRWRRRRVRRPKPVSGLRAGSIRTRAGTARIRFPRPVATTASVDNRFKQLTSDLTKKINAVEASAKAAIKKVDQTEDKNTSVLNKKVNAIDAKVKQGQMMAFLPMLMTKPPQITQVTVGTPPEDEDAPITVAKDAKIPIAETAYKKDDNMGMLLALMAMSGGLGGGTSDSSTMLILALALSGGFGGDNK